MRDELYAEHLVLIVILIFVTSMTYLYLITSGYLTSTGIDNYQLFIECSFYMLGLLYIHLQLCCLKDKYGL